jgi:hypothetical protein
MSPKLIEGLFKYIVYPLATKLVGYIVDKYFLSESREAREEKSQKRADLLKEIRKANTNEEIIRLSTELSTLNTRGEMPKPGSE